MSVFTTSYTTPWQYRVMDARIAALRAAGSRPPAPPREPWPEEEEKAA